MPHNLRSFSGAGGNEDLPPSPPPTPTELLATLIEGQCALVDALCNMANHDVRNVCQGPEPNQYGDFKDFLDTKPPIFKEADDPL
jgi:hypothetical protein